MKKTFNVDSTYNDMRIDRWIRNNLGNFPQGLIEKNLRNGKIKLNKKKIKSSHKVKTDDQVDLFNFEFKNTITQNKIKFQPSKEIIKANEDLIIDNNEDFIVLNKSAGISVQGGTKSKKNLVDIFTKSEIFHNTKPFSVHRLDKDTSGLLIIAKNETTYNYLTVLQKERKIKKQYIAIVQGIPKSPKARIEAPIGRNKFNRKTMSITKEGRYSLTEYTITKSNNNMSLLKITLLTGRTHQIRVHLKAIGHPVIGDILYGKKSKYANRQMLHAYKLSFKDNQNNNITVESEPEKDMKEFIEFYFNN